MEIPDQGFLNITTLTNVTAGKVSPVQYISTTFTTFKVLFFFVKCIFKKVLQTFLCTGSY